MNTVYEVMILKHHASDDQHYSFHVKSQYGNETNI